MNINEIFLAIFSFILSISIVLIVVCIGWYLVWRLFLSRFKLVREVLGQFNDDTPTHTTKVLTNKSSSNNNNNKTKKTRRD